MPDNGSAGHRAAADLSRRLADFASQYSRQFSLQFPRGVLRKIDEYRDSYFGYLQDSRYKSNICYLLQQVDYQLFLFRLFRPALVLKQTSLYSIIIQLGVIAESLAFSMLIDPFVVPDPNDRSKGEAALSPEELEFLSKISFHRIVDILQTSGTLTPDQRDEFIELKKIRNQVHLQNLGSSLYEEELDRTFNTQMQKFSGFLSGLSASLKIVHKKESVRSLTFAGIRTRFSGEIITVRDTYAFIQSAAFADNILFPFSKKRSDYSAPVRSGQLVSFLYVKDAPNSRPVAGDVKLEKDIDH